MEGSILYFIVGGLFILFGIISGRKTKAKTARCNVPVTGRIVRVEQDVEKSDNGYSEKTTYTPVFQYTVNGQIIEKSSNVSSANIKDYTVGDTAEILYNPLKPKEFVIKDKSAKSGMGFAVVLVLIGIVAVVVGFTQL